MWLNMLMFFGIMMRMELMMIPILFFLQFAACYPRHCFSLSKTCLLTINNTQYDDGEKDLFVDLGHCVPDVLLEVSIVVIAALFVEMMYKQHEYQLDVPLLLLSLLL